MEEDQERSLDKDGVPLLTKSNWNSVFKEEFLNWCLLSGEASDILLKEQDIVLDKPDYDEMRPPLLSQSGLPTDPTRVYSEDAVGVKRFERVEKRYEALTKGRRTIMAKLVSRLHSEVKTKVTTSPGYREAHSNLDILKVWKMCESVALGSGAISTYQLTTKVLRSKQEADFATYSKTFHESVSDLNKQGTAEEVLKKITNTIFILGLNQAQFKDKLTPIYGSKEWPNHDDLANELHAYSEAIRGMESLQMEQNEGALGAHKVNTWECFNCGSTDHLKRDCPKDEHPCGVCGGSGHLEKFCRDKDKKDRYRRPSAYHKSEGTKRHDNKQENNKNSGRKPFQKKMNGRTQTIRKAMIALVDQLAESQDNEELEEAPEPEYEEDPYDDELEYDDYHGRLHAKMIREQPDELNQSFMATSSDANKPVVIIDTGCNGTHVFKPDLADLVSNVVPSNKKLYGVGGESLSADRRGKLGDKGRVLVVPRADASLLSPMENLKHVGGSFRGDAKTLDILDAEGNVVLTGRNYGDGFWRCTPEEIRRFSCLIGVTQPDDMSSGDAQDESDVEEPPAPAVLSPQLDAPILHLTSEEMNRAKRAHHLCAQLGHPGSKRLMEGLDNNNYDTDLTSQDVRNGLAVYGGCVPCLVSKMKADPTPKESLTPPAPTIGHTLHVDIVPLTHMSLGQNTALLHCVDEKSGYVNQVALKNKGTAALNEAFDAIVAFYRVHGHTVVNARSDAESNFRSCKVHLNRQGIHYAHSPAGAHEKLAERSIQSCRTRKLCLENTLAYELPRNLEAESWLAAGEAMNRTTSSRSGKYTPYQLVFGHRPPLPQFHFGQTGVFHKRRADTPNQRTEWGIFLSHGDGPRNYRAYIPTRTGVYSLRKFVPHPEYPREWNLRPRIRPPDPKPVKLEQSAPVKMEHETKHMQALAPPPGLPTPPAHRTPNIDTQTSLLPTPALPPVIRDQESVYQTPAVYQEPAVSDGQQASPAVTPVLQVSPPVVSTPPVPPPAVPAEPVHQQPGVPVRTSRQRTTRESAIQEMERRRRTGGASLPAQNTASAAPPAVSTTAAGPQPDPEPPPNASTRPTRQSAQHNWQSGPARMRGWMARIFNDPHGPLATYAYRMSLRRALQDTERRKSTLSAVDGEIDNMEEGNVLDFVLYQNIPTGQRKTIIPAHMFMKDKFRADGSFDKMKARLVANGDRQHPDTVGETFSPTVNQISVFAQLNVTASTGAYLSAYDIKGAFLVTPVDRDRPKIYLRIPAEVAEHWIRLRPERAKYLSQDGCLYASLNKYIYGLQEASHEFNNLLHKKLVSMGFRASRADRCVYVKRTPVGTMIASTHVDDILFSAPTLQLRGWFEKELETSLEIVRQYDDISYLGMNIEYDQPKRTLRVSQSGSVKDLVAKHGMEDLRKHPATPADASLLTQDSTSPACDKTSYLSLVMSLMYIARLTRPDVLMPVTLLATRSATPSESDMSRLRRVLRYLAGTADVGIVFNGNRPITPRIYADASHITHIDGLSQAGVMITLGSAPILCRSYKIKVVTRSSSESELHALEEASTYSGWLKLLLADLGIPVHGPVPVFQDNKSTIVMAMQGGHFKKIKHMLVREAFVTERIRDGDIELFYLPTKEMPADILTKPLPEASATTHMRFMCMS